MKNSFVNSKPIEFDWFEAMRTNDWRGFIGTMTEEKQALLEGCGAEEASGSVDNIAFVYADFSVEYDPAKSPFTIDKLHRE